MVVTFVAVAAVVTVATVANTIADPSVDDGRRAVWGPGVLTVAAWAGLDVGAFLSGARDMVQLGGVAFAGARGVERVEVQAEGGEWVPASLRAPLSDLTWVVWRAEVKVSVATPKFVIERVIPGAGKLSPQELHS